jgi:hypothetical protein
MRGFSALVWLSAFVALSCSVAAHASKGSTRQENYGLGDTHQKLVDNRGDGFERLYGTRNLRYVLKGLVYRGGANNTRHREHPRDNRNPLPDDGLTNLCREGFSTAVYLYSKNYEVAPARVSCWRPTDAAAVTRYVQLSPTDRSEMRRILESVHEAIEGRTRGAIYLHCWNGWHASGLASALVLRQFCDLDPEAAVRYWNLNADGYTTEKHHEQLRRLVREFVPYQDLPVSPDRRRQVCPSRCEVLSDCPAAPRHQKGGALNANPVTAEPIDRPVR